MSHDSIFKIQTLNNISDAGLSRLPKDNYVHGSDIDDPHAILVRSANLLELEPSKNLLAVCVRMCINFVTFSFMVFFPYVLF